MTPEEIARDKAISEANAPSAATLANLNLRNQAILDMGIIFVADPNFIEKTVAQAKLRQALALQTLL